MVSQDMFVTLTNEYKKNLAEYRVTGNVANKTAYENALRGIQEQLASKQKTIQNDADYIKKFLDTYADTNPKLDKLHKQSQAIQKIGPQVQDQLIQSERLNELPPPDSTHLYVKAGVAMGLVLIIIFAST